MPFPILASVAPPSECAEAAAKVLAAYAGKTEITSGHLADLLTDLAHLAHERGWPFEVEARNALINCKTERGQ